MIILKKSIKEFYNLSYIVKYNLLFMNIFLLLFSEVMDMKKYMKIFISALLSGLFICLGATVYLLTYGINKVLGGALFGIGLFTIIQFDLWLYTGKVGFLLNNKVKYLLDLFVCFIGNALGISLSSLVISCTRMGDSLYQAAYPLASAKYNDSFYSILILSFFCGVMIYLAVKGYKECTNTLGKILFVFVPVILFIICGFEHVIANIAYFVYAKMFDWKVLLYLFIMFIGNGVGSIFFNETLKLIKKLNEKEVG